MPIESGRMAFLRLKNRGDTPERGSTSKKSGGHRWVLVPAVGAALALWSLATLAGLYSVSNSLTAASNGLPRSLLAPRNIAARIVLARLYRATGQSERFDAAAAAAIALDAHNPQACYYYGLAKLEAGDRTAGAGCSR